MEHVGLRIVSFILHFWGFRNPKSKRKPERREREILKKKKLHQRRCLEMRPVFFFFLVVVVRTSGFFFAGLASRSATKSPKRRVLKSRIISSEEQESPRKGPVVRWVERLTARRARQVFRDLDVDNDGFLTQSQGRIGLARIDGSTTEVVASKLDFDRFLELATRENSLKKSLRRLFKSDLEWRRLFEALDANPKDGYLTATEVQMALTRLKVKMPLRQVSDLIREYDDEGDGRLDFIEFSKLATDVYNRRLDLATARANKKNGQEQVASSAARRVAEFVEVTTKRKTEERALEQVERRIETYLNTAGSFDDPKGVLKMQDDLYLRFKAKQHLDDNLDARRVRLLAAIRDGDVGAIRASTDMNWDFVFPPAVDVLAKILKRNFTKNTEPSQFSYFSERLEGWCRTPLCLLIRPDEGNLKPFLPGISKRARLELIEDVLASGCCDPNFPAPYWSAPCIHASFEGDVEALALLYKYGADLTGKVYWLCQAEPKFSLAHAAAFNGNLKILKWLKGKVPASLFRSVDGDDSNPLHTALESSCDLDTATFLLEDCGCDGYARNAAKRSPLSMAVERLPIFAATLLRQKSRFEYRWWGNDLYKFSYDGLILPREPDGSPLAFTSISKKKRKKRLIGGDTPKNNRPTNNMGSLLLFKTSESVMTLEDLIAREDRKELLELPVLRDLIERKWRAYGSSIYSRRIVVLLFMLAAVFVESNSPADSAPFVFAAITTLFSWSFFLRLEIRELVFLFTRKKKALSPETVRLHFTSSIWNVLDFVNLVLAPSVALLKIFAMTEHSPNWDFIFAIFPGRVDQETLDAAAPLVGLLNLSLAFRILQYASMYRSIGPLLVTLLGMLGDFVRFSTLLAVIIVGFANAFYTLLHYSGCVENAPAYADIVRNMLLWLCGQVSYDLFEDLPEGALSVGARTLFSTYLVTCYFIGLNLLVAIFNSTYSRVIQRSTSEWLMVRLQALREFEGAPDLDGVETYFKQLETITEQRTIGRGGKSQSQHHEDDSDFFHDDDDIIALL